MRAFVATIATLLTASTFSAGPIQCDLSQYKSSPGLTATVQQDLLVLSWPARAEPGCARGLASKAVSLRFATSPSERLVARGPCSARTSALSIA